MENHSLYEHFVWMCDDFCGEDDTLCATNAICDGEDQSFYDRTRNRWPFNKGDCLIEVTTWAGFTVHYIMSYKKKNIHNKRKAIVLSVLLRVTDSDYPFGIFKLIFNNFIKMDYGLCMFYVTFDNISVIL
jgi:hypothetical protein